MGGFFFPVTVVTRVPRSKIGTSTYGYSGVRNSKKGAEAEGRVVVRYKRLVDFFLVGRERSREARACALSRLHSKHA